MIPKFRLYDPSDQKIREVAEINWPLKIVWSCGGVIEHELDNVELMQSTGLKDKNGAEIFEGDIVRSFSNINKISDPHLTETIEPKYDNRIVIYTNGAFVLSDDGKREYSGVLNHYVGAMVKDLEVIGNICEDGELLSETITQLSR